MAAKTALYAKTATTTTIDNRHKTKPKFQLRWTFKAMAITIPSLPGNGFADLLSNRPFVTGFVSASLAQLLKILTEYVKTGELNPNAFIMSGGMPSSHSSVCVAVTTSVAMQQGLGSALFAVAFCFTCIVMYDAAGIRRHAGYQAKILNQLMTGLRPDLGDQATLKEVLGHSRREVLGGAFLGVLIGVFWPM